MRILSRYVFRQTAGALVLILVSLTGVTWIAVALRQLELMTTQGQDVLRFLAMTSLAIPSMMALIAPIALLIASIHVLNRLNGDSELIVMAAGGMPAWSLLRPLGLLAFWWSLGIAFVNHVAGPWAQQKLRGARRAGAHRPDGPGHPALAVHLPGGQAHGAYSRPCPQRRAARADDARCARSQAGRHLPGGTRPHHQAGRRGLSAHGEGTYRPPPRKGGLPADRRLRALCGGHQSARAAERSGASSCARASATPTSS